MTDSTFRLRRAAVALLVGAGAVGGVIAGAAGIAGAADTLASGSTIAATSAPAIPSTGTQAAGGLTITIAGGSTVTAGDTVNLAVTAGSGTVDWAGASASATGITVTGTSGIGSNILKLTVGAFSSTSAATINVTGVSYSTSAATGTLAVVATLNTSTPSLIGTFAPTTGVANATLPTTGASFSLAAATTPTIGAGVTKQAAGNWKLGLYGATTTGWTAGDTVSIDVEVPGTTTNCTGGFTTPESVGFAAVPTAAVTAVTGAVSTLPAVSVSLGQTTACSGTSVNDALIVKFTNSGSMTSAAGTNQAPSATITLSGIAYNVSAAAPAGNVVVSATASTGASVVDGTAAPGVTVTNNSTAAPGPSNASVSAVTLTANSPAVSVPVGAVNQPISNITLTESAAGQVTGAVTLTLTDSAAGHTAVFDAASTPKVAATGGATVGAVTGMGTDALSFTISTPSSSTGSYTVSGLTVDTPASPVGNVTVTAAFTPAGAATSPVGPATAFTVSQTVTIYGPTADATAAQEFETAFPYASGICPGSGANGLGSSPNRPAVIATNANYPDALAAAYLARNLGTGELLTGPTSLSSSTINALRLEGITKVYLVGGPLAISSAVESQLSALPAYNCGGSSAVTSLLGTAVNISVQRIAGQTEYGTAQDIAEFSGSGAVQSAAFSGAYAGTNTSGGNGMYNDTSGTASTGPGTSVALPTAILATGQGFQDAEAASTLAYKNGFPILLTTPTALSPEAQTAMQALGIKQVILMGGPLAVSNSVVTSLQGMGISVLRIAGQDYTDTAVQLANFEVNTTVGGLGLGWTPSGTVVVARGDFYTDGLAGAVVAATGSVPGASACTVNVGTGVTSCSYAKGTPLLLTLNPTTVGQYLTGFLNTAGTAGIDNNVANKISSLTILGGPLAVTPATISAMQTALGG